MLCIVPVEAASGIEGLVVSSVEELVCQVEGIFLIGAGLLDLRSDGIERQVASDNGLSGVLLAAGGLQEPAAHLHAFLGSSSSVVDIELADGLVLLTGKLTQHGLLVCIDIGQCEVGLLNEGQHIVE